jgi:RNA polymerase sigma-70 factor (ECF subfamily)
MQPFNAYLVCKGKPGHLTDHQHLHQDLIDRCKNGDDRAFQSLYKLYAKAMYNVSFRITAREEDAQDAVQESFISAYRNIQHYRGDSSFGAWIKRIVVNRSINILRVRRAQLWPDDDRFDVEEPEAPEVYKEDLTVDRIRQAIMNLPDGYRSVVSLYLLEGYDHEEIATILGISESTSKSQLNRAKARLREQLTAKV